MKSAYATKTDFQNFRDSLKQDLIDFRRSLRLDLHDIRTDIVDLKIGQKNLTTDLETFKHEMHTDMQSIRLEIRESSDDVLNVLDGLMQQVDDRFNTLEAK